MKTFLSRKCVQNFSQNILNSMVVGTRQSFKFSDDAAQKMKFSIKDFFSKCDQIHWKLGIWSHLLKKSLMTNFIFCAV